MMEFTLANPVVEGEADGGDFTITSVVDTRARTCDSLEVTRSWTVTAFAEEPTASTSSVIARSGRR